MPKQARAHHLQRTRPATVCALVWPLPARALPKSARAHAVGLDGPALQAKPGSNPRCRPLPARATSHTRLTPTLSA